MTEYKLVVVGGKLFFFLQVLRPKSQGLASIGLFTLAGQCAPSIQVFPRNGVRTSIEVSLHLDRGVVKWDTRAENSSRKIPVFYL